MNCEYCGNKITEIPRPCKYCGHYFCTHCRLPEEHSCQGLKHISKQEQRKYQETMAELASKHAKINDKGYEDIIDIERRKHYPKHEEHKKHKEYEPHLYRHTSPKEKKKGDFQVDEKYRKEYVGKRYETKEHYYPHRKFKINFFTKLWLLWVILFGILIIIYCAFSFVTEEKSELRNTTKMVSYNETISDKISFKDYLENIYTIDGTEGSIKGMLERDVQYQDSNQLTGVYVESITDDFSNQIELINLKPYQKKLFPNKGTSKEIYEIIGKFKRSYKTLKFEVKEITLSKRNPAGLVEKQKLIDYTENFTLRIVRPKYPLIRSFVFNLLGKEVLCDDGTPLHNCSKLKPYMCELTGLTQNPQTCGCPKGERIYKNSCIKEIKCSDNTLHPDCSISKPKQCLNGELIDNADLCGCPNDYKKVENKCQKILRCSDGTIYGECSKNKPNFCSAGKLVKDSDLCGCDWGYKSYKGDCLDSDKVESIEATDYLNEIRAANGRNPVKWDERLYELAIYRTKDMYDRGYFDHVTPDGKCVKDFKGDYGLSDYNIAENAGAVMYGYDGDKVDYASYADVKEQIDGWMESRGHRYNLLYPSHTLGVAACYKGACVFLGANQEYYGLGYGPCTTGDEGTAFWNSVGTQPGET